MWLLLLLGLVLVGGALVYGERRDRARALSVLALAAPLATIYFYRNAWPYFYVSILPGACLLAGAVWRRIEVLALRRPLLAGALALAVAVLVARTGWQWFEANHDERTLPQRDLVAAVHEIFPEPVPYIDRCGMVSSFSKVGPFMTSWSMASYRERKTPILEDLIREKQPKLLLANVESLQLKRAFRKTPASHRWLPEDYAILQDNFVHHWGAIWVAGKSLVAPVEEEALFEILVPGPYTLEARGLVEIDGNVVEPRAVVMLKQGERRLRAVGDKPQNVTLRWGASLPRPPRAPAKGPIFWGFNWKKEPPS